SAAHPTGTARSNPLRSWYRPRRGTEAIRVKGETSRLPIFPSFETPANSTLGLGTTALFVPQRLDGIEVGRFPCRVDSEDHSHSAGDGEAGERPENRHCRRQRLEDHAHGLCDHAARKDADG